MDKQIVRALQLNPRVAFSQIADVLGVAEQTVARRYRRLRRDGLVRVTTVVNPRALGQTNWLVRVRCRPEGARPVANGLAERSDVSWATIQSAGWEVVFNLRARADRDREDLLARLLPKATPVLDVSVAAILHTFVGGDSTDWQGWRDVLSTDQNRQLTPPAPHSPSQPVHLDPGDQPVLDLLARDGRTSHATLARAAGMSTGRVARRLDALTGSGVIYFDVDIAPAATGQYTHTSVWLTVAPSRLETVGRTLAGHDAVPFAAATTGPTNLAATVTTVGLDGAYQFVIDTLAGLEGITGYELSPLLRRVKQADATLDGDRLAQPVPSNRRHRSTP